MFKFLKELVDSAKEGIEEGISEAKEEIAPETESERAESIARIEAIPYDEKFGVALCAHFRAAIFMDWSNIFKNDDEDDHLYPVHLYTFGSYPELEENKQELERMLRLDTDVIDRETCLSALAIYFDLADIPRKGTLLDGIHGIDIAHCNEKAATESAFQIWDVSKQGISAVLSCMVSYIITSSTDVGYIRKADGIHLLRIIVRYAKEHYQSWADYNENFFIGESAIGLHDKEGVAILREYAEYLSEKKGSPWNNIEWHGDCADTYDTPPTPTLYEQTFINNRSQCDILCEHGDSPDIHRKIDFLIVFRNADDLNSVAAKLLGQGFVEVDREQDKDGWFRLSLTLDTVPALPNINRITSDILYLLENIDATFDGWGCSVVEE